jgi:hypothetical protein
MKMLEVVVATSIKGFSLVKGRYLMKNIPNIIDLKQK